MKNLNAQNISKLITEHPFWALVCIIVACVTVGYAASEYKNTIAMGNLISKIESPLQAKIQEQKQIIGQLKIANDSSELQLTSVSSQYSDIQRQNSERSEKTERKLNDKIAQLKIENERIGRLSQMTKLSSSLQTKLLAGLNTYNQYTSHTVLDCLSEELREKNFNASDENLKHRLNRCIDRNFYRRGAASSVADTYTYEKRRKAHTYSDGRELYEDVEFGSILMRKGDRIPKSTIGGQNINFVPSQEWPQMVAYVKFSEARILYLPRGRSQSSKPNHGGCQL